MKILTRLSKEGSSADEPLNIPLSDYSSDEGESSSSSDDEGKDSLCDLEGPCCQVLRVPPCSPVLLSPEKKPLSTKKKISGKSKQRRRISPQKRNKLLTRSVMDLPTTDPGSDFPDYYTTEDECETDYDTEGNVSKISLARNTKIIRNELRKASSASCDAVMPPELIITSHKAMDDNQLLTSLTDLPIENKSMLDTKPPSSFSQNIIKEFPPIGKKTKSWHNFNRCMSTIKIRNINCDTDPTYETAENLQFKLSLKKQIWTGTQQSDLDFKNRPLSYGLESSTIMMFNKSIFYDSEALLTACSQKLTAWQENSEIGLEKLKLSRSHVKESKKFKQGSKNKIESRNETKNVIKDEILNNNIKTKRKSRSSFHKLVETADIISHLAKNTKSSSAKIKKPIVQQQATNSNLEPSTNTTKLQKFRTSSYVATALASSSRRQRKSLTLQTPPLTLITPPQKPMLNTEQNSDSEQENTIKIPIRRTRAKSLKLFREVAARKCEKMS
ncbi:hypothetical protein PVAND_014260 [Polypedilum vanderplanki]|uniref:Uncharacterized protein n=1 Tax=Polypedilum vanderplanki TaxID=319348 RepID=A0A9J6CTL5_POLVA|nr:hypothetical protein PVAND_014260 [Polypedilum vanderplanki]